MRAPPKSVLEMLPSFIQAFIIPLGEGDDFTSKLESLGWWEILCYKFRGQFLPQYDFT